MMVVVKKNLDAAMMRSRTDVALLEDATHIGMYSTLITGAATVDDINDVASLLKCSMEYLIGASVETGASHEFNVIRVYGERIAARMKKLNWNRTSLSDYTGIPATSLQSYRNRDVNYMTVQTAETIAYGLRCSLKYLTKECDTPQQTTVYRISKRYKKSVHMEAVDMIKLKSYISRNNISLDDLSMAISCPAYLIRYKLEKHGKFPAYSAAKINDIFSRIDMERDVKAMKEEYKKEAAASASFANIPTMPASTSKVSRQRKQLQDSVTPSPASTLTPVPIMDQQEAYARIKKFGGELGKSETYGTLKAKAEEARIRNFGGEICKPESAEVAAKVVSTAKMSELLELATKIAELDDNDYNEIVSHIRWLISKANA